MGPNGGKFRLSPAKPNLQVEWLTQSIDNSITGHFRDKFFTLSSQSTRQSAISDFVPGTQCSGATWRVTVNNSLRRRLLACVRIWSIMWKQRNLQNRKYITYCSGVTERPSHDYSKTHRKFRVWACFWDMPAGRQKHTDIQTRGSQYFAPLSETK